MISDEQYLQFSPLFAQEDIEKEEDRLKFLELLGTLPPAVKTLLTSEDTAEKVINAGKTFKIDEFDTEAVSLVIRKIATGEILINDGADLIAKETELSPERAESLFGLIVSEILAPVMENIKKVQPTKLSQKPIAPPTQNYPGQPEPDQTTNPRIVDLRNR